ncbi:MAG: DedA family protein [Candidatus Omnitrophica bacterium]|nr:DedA family protein [Candidatus Omnitrophota bacterium]
MHALIEWTVHLASTPYGAWGLFGIAFAEASFFPVPPDLLQIALSVAAPERAFFYAAIALVGSVTGAALGYAIGLIGGRPLCLKILKEQRMHTVEETFRKYDVWAIAVAGFTPIPYKVFAIAGGAFRIHFWRFIGVSVLSRGARFFLVAGTLYFFGEGIKDALYRNINLFSILFVALLAGGFLAAGWMGKRRTSTPTARPDSIPKG